MLIFRRIAALFFVLIVALGFDFSAAHISDDGIKKTTERDYCFDDDRLLIGGYNFNLKNSDDTHVSYVKEAGIDFLITSADKNFLDLCEKYDIGVIAKGYNASPLYYDGDTSSWYNISSRTYNDHPALWGDDLIDEPVSSMFPELGRVAEHYYANTDGKFILINLFPNYANEEQLGETNGEGMKNTDFENFLFGNEFLSMAKWEFGFYGPFSKYYSKCKDYTDEETIRYVKHVQSYVNNIDTDYICVDIYPLKHNDKTGGGWLRNLDILAEACLKSGKKLWVITQASGQIEGGNRYCDTKEDILWQMFTSMSFGARAIIHACYNGGWWDTDSHLIDADGNRTATYYAVREADNEVSAFADIYADYDYIGTKLYNPTLAEGASSGYICEMNGDPKMKVTTVSPVLAGCFEKDGGRAYTFVNMSASTVGAKAAVDVKFDNAKSLTVYRNGEKTEISSDRLDIVLENQEGIYVTVNE